MKPSQALFACSLLGVACAISCGSDDDKTKVVATDGGAGGEGAVVEPGDGGKAGERPVVGEGGAGGEPPLVVPGGAGEGGQALGGAGGEPAACVGFETRGAGGEGGAAHEPAPRFTCDGLAGTYRPSTGKITFLTPPGLEPAVSGTFVTTYDYYPSEDDQIAVRGCTEGTVVGKETTWELSATYQGAPIYEDYDSFQIRAAAVKDACGAEVQLSTASETLEGSCFNIRFAPTNNEDVWNVDCYEGFNSDCFTEQTCPVVTLPQL